MNVNIEVNNIVLNDIAFSESEVPALRQALQSELAALFNNRPDSISPSREGAPRKPAVRLIRTETSNRTSLGHHLAREMYGVLGHADNQPMRDLGGSTI